MNRNKNIKKNLKRCITLVLGTSLLTTASLSPDTVWGANNGAVLTTTESVRTNYKASNKSEDKTEKQETVYVSMDATGKVKKTTVSDWLKIDGAKGAIEDNSILNDIENNKGDEKYSREDNDVIWNAEGEDIYYSGTTDKELPVAVEFSYELDGKSIDPEELLGKSGNLTIHIKYINNSVNNVLLNGKTEEIYTPFVMITGMILPVDNFTDVKIDNGTVVSEGNNNIVVGYGVPGLKESLDLKNLSFGEVANVDLSDINDKLTDEVTIEANVTDFEIGSTYSIASSNIFSDVEIDDVGDMDKLTESMDKLKDATVELLNGSEKLCDGINKISDGIDAYTDGVHTAADGSSKLSEGSEKLADAIKKYTAGNTKLLKGVKTYANGTKQICKGTKTYAESTAKLVDGIKTAQSGSSEVASGSAAFAKNLSTYTASVNENFSSEKIDGLLSKLPQLKEGLEKLSGGVSKISAGMTGEGGLKEGVEKLSAGVSGENGLEAGLDALMAGTDSLKGGASQLKEGVLAINEGNKVLTASNDKIDSYVNTIIQLAAEAQSKGDYEKALEYKEIATYLGTAKVVTQKIDAATATDGPLVGGIAQLDGGLDSLKGGLNSAKTGAEAIGAGLKQISGGVDALAAGTEEVKKGLDTASKGINIDVENLSKGIKELVGATNKLNTAYSTQLDTGIQKLNGGMSEVLSGGTLLTSNNEKLISGSKKLINNTSKIKKNANKVIAASPELASGAGKLSDSVHKLKSGLHTLDSNSVKIADAISKLYDGADKLNEGMSEYKKTGIDKLTDSVESLIDKGDDFKNRLSKITQISNDYNTFSGLSNDMDGSVKFILSTSSIEKK